MHTFLKIETTQFFLNKQTHSSSVFEFVYYNLGLVLLLYLGIETDDDFWCRWLFGEVTEFDDDEVLFIR